MFTIYVLYYTGKIINDKIKKLKAQFLQTKTRLSTQPKSGSGAADAARKKPWLYYEPLLFLDQHVTARKGTSNMAQVIKEWSVCTLVQICYDKFKIMLKSMPQFKPMPTRLK